VPVPPHGDPAVDEPGPSEPTHLNFCGVMTSLRLVKVYRLEEVLPAGQMNKIKKAIRPRKVLAGVFPVYSDGGRPPCCFKLLRSRYRRSKIKLEAKL